MSRGLAERNLMVDWQVAPADYEIANYDKYKFEYRRAVEEYLNAVPKKNLKKKTFVTISTNILCAEIASSKDTIDPIDRDIYLPLEICLVKWSVSDATKQPEERQSSIKSWIINPGKPPLGCVNHASDHEKKHKIKFSRLDSEQDEFVESDLNKIMREINSHLTPDRVVFSLSLRHCRQDVGSLKWLNRETGYKTKPIKCYSLEDLYVVLIRSFVDDDMMKSSICQGLAKHRMVDTSDPYEPKLQCHYHRQRASEDDSQDSLFCANALSQSYVTVLLNDVKLYTEVFSTPEQLVEEESSKCIRPKKPFS